VSAPEILFFWVARMIMSGLHFMGDVPYTHIYLHGTVRDTQHRKMSKSLGNGIDPLEVVERYGADALRYSLVSGMSVGTDVILDPDDLEASFAAGRNFANKLWNAGRFILSNLDGPPRPLAGRASAVRRDELTLADRWILARCEATVREATEAYEKFRLNEAAGAVYRFLWSDLADWYIEQIKPRLYGDVPGGDVARAVAVQTFDVALRLLHPVMPFVTETLWRRIPGRPSEASISVAPWPCSDARAEDPEALTEFGLVQQVVGAIRAIRAEYGVQPGQTVRAFVSQEGRAPSSALERERGTIVRLAKLSDLVLTESTERVGGHAVLPDGTAVFVPLGDAIDVARECDRLGTEAERLASLLASQEKKLGNEQFVARAPADVVAREREKLGAWSEQREVLLRKRERLGCG
jgi:valyl-tRNA synthetase